MAVPDAGNEELTKRALRGALKFQIALAVMIFAPALTLNYWQGWLFWLVFFACIWVNTVYFLRHDPALIARRMKAGPIAEKEPKQKLIQLFAVIFMCAMIVLSALDHLFGWSEVSWPVVLFGDALVILGYVIIFVVFRENTFAASIIQVDAGQKVVSSGPYAVVRHPMYAGAMPMIFGIPLALGSWWGMLPAGLLAGVIIWRLLDEENYLARNLTGYADYQRKVRRRLVPGVW